VVVAQRMLEDVAKLIVLLLPTKPAM